ncbi:MAG: 2,3-bisphosphoglycerate-independent phosphoglycerate mutase [Dehalococcoidales bacterium]|nr:2,3-bisphosphoglycerate-independent phosphoglycerate mutase [Dehalococcoidales bacterium]
MDSLELMRNLAQPSTGKIVLMVLDGLGGLPRSETGKTELETADTPNLDRLAKEGTTGLIDIVSPGITPGSAAGHLALFGYGPIRFIIGRGALEAVGIDFDLKPGDVAARGNFCTVDKKGLVTDRRAGRITNEECTRLCGLLDGMTIENTRLFVRPVREHRFIVVFRGDGLNPAVSDSDPQQLGVPPRAASALQPGAAKTVSISNKFIAQAKRILAGQHPANMLLLRGFSERPDFPAMTEIYKLKPAAIAVYPMYRGLARLVGMDILDPGTGLEDELKALKANYSAYDFFFLHVKGTDSAGEDGDFERKVSVIEELDRALPELIDTGPDVLIVTGDHSTPAILKGHSWHPVPVLLHSRWCRPDRAMEFGESACASGGLGRFPATQVMPLAMAHALKLRKFGA